MTDPWKLGTVEHSTHDELVFYSLHTAAYVDLRKQETERLKGVLKAITKELQRREDPQKGADS